ncbi:MAG: toxin-antitoxin system HicB family antitoxin [Planctomycetaceae bacterium]
MATLSLRMRDDLKRKAQTLAERQGVSLNNYINSVVAASIAQEETLRFFRDRLQDVDLAALHKRVLKFMEKSRPGVDPSPDELRRLGLEK